MKKTERLGEATAPDGTVLTFLRHDGAYSIRVHGVELMSTRRHHSEERFGELVCEPLRQVAGARVLIGGLGLGFTLEAALRSLAADARVTVVEIVQEVIDWNLDPEYPLGAAALRDARVDLRHDDVANVLKSNPRTFDAILLDVDNGADPLTTRGNAALYRTAGIEMAAAALRPGGWLAYWLADRDPAFEKSLRRAGLTVEETKVRAHVTSGAWHYLLVARAGG
ncbi:MAG: hypothetical protein JWM41_4922 [Gemmatimonadetes bacterium]|nr:hypothetical protein [Gemmatimonadota bacterium]